MGLERDFEGSFREDCYKGVSGPFSVPPHFIADLKQIDPRLVVRWMPPHYCYMVWIRMENSGKLWCQPAAILRDEAGNPRKPTSRDVYCIRRANWIARHDGSKAFIDAMDKQMIAQNRMAADHREKLTREWSQDACKRYDLTTADMGITRKAITSKGKTEGLASVNS